MYQQRQAPRPGGVGSVKKARERAEAGLPSEAPSPLRPRPYEIPLQQNRQRPQAPAGFTGSRNEQGQMGVAISRPTQLPQWPLPSGADGASGARVNQEYHPPQGRGRPQRPPRPSHVPSMLDASRLQEHTPSFQYHNVQSPEEPYSRDTDNDITSPITPSSRPSTVSSVGTIPDFPVPLIPQVPQGQARRSANLGPPPSARRGASSYYSQASFVSPIPEESPRTTLAPSHQSYASSAAMPNNYWGPGSPGSRSDDMDDDYAKDRYYEDHMIEEGRESRGSNGDDSDDRGLIRSASLGKRAKPSMVTTKSFERSDSATRPSGAPKIVQPKTSATKLERIGVIDGLAGASVPLTTLNAPTTTSDGQRQTFWPVVGNPDSPLATGTGLIDQTPSNSEESIPTLSRIAREPPFPTNTSSTTDAKVNPILGAYNAASSLSPGPAQARTPSPSGFKRLSEMRRPPRLDMDAVRDAEARGSLTSLPDLIRRATKLASMMDRGKRPGSRLNDLSDFPSEIDLSSRDKELSPGNTRNSGISGMLAAFPPPGLATPKDEFPRPQSSWPVGFGPEGKNGATTSKKPGRRCCGLPRWLFVFMLLGLLIVIAAAVVIPVYFFVIRKNNDSMASFTPLEQCQRGSTTSCQNGGVASLSTGACSCICINGFAGSTCTIPDQGACTTSSLADSSVANVTFGDSLPRLISSSQSNFSIPLREQVILARFNTADLSCVSQNALVTFNGQSQRIGSANLVVQPSSTATGANPSVTPKSSNRRRQESQTTSSSMPVATTDGGILYDPSLSDSQPATDVASEPAGASFNITQEVLDFARVAVLFVLQEENVDNAIAAQTSLQRFFRLSSPTNRLAGNVSIGNEGVVNLVDFRLNLGQGVVGGRNTTSTVKGRSAGRSRRDFWGDS